MSRSVRGRRGGREAPDYRKPSGGPGRRAAARLLAAGLLAAALVGGIALGAQGLVPLARRYFPPALTVSSVSVRGAERVPAGELAALVAEATGDGAAGFSLARIAAHLETHPWISEARVLLLRPGRLLVDVVERDPAATLQLTDGSHWLVDGSGTPFLPLPRRAADLPLLIGPEAVELGVPHSLLAEGIALAALVEGRGLGDVKAIRVMGAHPGSLPQLTLRGRSQTVIVGAGQAADKLERLAALLASGLPEVQRASEIDLRFGDRMVLRGGPSLTGGEAAATRGRAEPSEPRPLG